MSEIITREQLAKSKLAVALTSLMFCGIGDIPDEELGKKTNLEYLLKVFVVSNGCYDDKVEMVIRALKQIPENDRENIVFVTSSENLELCGLENSELPREFVLLKKYWKRLTESGVYAFFNNETGNLYLVNAGAGPVEFSNAIDIALCGKQDLEKNNIDINNIPKARYSDEIFREICDFDPNRSREIDNITQNNFLDYSPIDYFIKRFGLVDKSSNNVQEDIELLFKFFESKGISRTSIDNFMMERLLIKIVSSVLNIIKITTIGFSYGGNKAQVNYLFNCCAEAKKDKCEYGYECITVNGLELSQVQKNYFKDKIGADKANDLINGVLKVKGTKDWVSPVETGVSANTVFFETDKNACNPHMPFSLQTDKSPVKQGNLHKLFSYFFESVKKFIDNNPKNNRAYNVLHACLSCHVYGKDLNGNKIKFKKIDVLISWFVVLKSVFFACFKFVGIKIKDCFMFLFLRKKYKKEIKIIDTPEKEKPKEENHNKENKEIDTPKEELKIPKMKNVVNEANKAIG